MDVVAAADLLVAGCGGVPVLQDARRIALAVAGRVAEAVEEVARRAAAALMLGLRIAGDEGLVVVDDVEFALHRVDDDLIQLGIVVNGVAVQPVAPGRTAREVDVDPARVIGDGLSLADVVGLGRVDVLHTWSKNHHSQTTLPSCPLRRSRPSRRRHRGRLRGSAPAAMACS